MFMSHDKIMRCVRAELAGVGIEFDSSLEDSEVLEFLGRRLRAGLSQRNRVDFPDGDFRYGFSQNHRSGRFCGWLVRVVSGQVLV